MFKVAFVVASLVAASGAVAQDFDAITIRLDEMTEADWTAIQRGNAEAEWQCLQDALADAKANGASPDETYVTFEDPEVQGVSVGIGESDWNYTCEEGEMRSYEGGKYDVLRSYR